MNSGIFPDYLERHGIRAFVPSSETIKSKIVDIISELFKGKNENGGSRINEIVRSSYEQTGIPKKVVCLACTELPLAFEDKSKLEIFTDNEVFYLNTTIIHANATFRYAIEGYV